MTLYDASVPHFQRMLGNVERWLDTAVAHAHRRKFDPEVLVSARLAPDQWPLARQVGGVCDTAKFTVARLCAKEAPKHSDDQKTLGELRARIHSVLGFLAGFKRDDFAGAGERVVAPPVLAGKEVLGSVYLFEMQLPNFYFHATTAYAILRHNGVELGKWDYLGAITTR